MRRLLRVVLALLVCGVVCVLEGGVEMRSACSRPERTEYFGIGG